MHAFGEEKGIPHIRTSYLRLFLPSKDTVEIHTSWRPAVNTIRLYSFSQHRPTFRGVQLCAIGNLTAIGEGNQYLLNKLTGYPTANVLFTPRKNTTTVRQNVS